MEDTRIAELHGMAEAYVEYRDERMELLKKEVAVKERLLSAMKKHGKTDYVHNGIEIHVVQESETVKVKLRKQEPAGATIEEKTDAIDAAATE